MTITAKINTVKIMFDRKAGINATLRNWYTGEELRSGILLTTTHKGAFSWLEDNSVEAFLFRIDPNKPVSGQKRIINKIKALGFTISDSNYPGGHYNLYASR